MLWRGACPCGVTAKEQEASLAGEGVGLETATALEETGENDH